MNRPPYVVVKLYDVQPCDRYLCKEIVDDLFSFPDAKNLFRMTMPIRIYQVMGTPFRFYNSWGSENLYVAHKLDIALIPFVAAWPEQDEFYLDEVMDTYNDGVRSWDDLDGRILPEMQLAEKFM